MDGRIALAYAKRLYHLAEGPQGPQGEPGSGAVGTVAEAYSTSKTYAVGDYVIHDEEFYRCTTAITTAEAFNSAHWTKLVLTDEVSDLKSDIDGLNDAVFEIDEKNIEWVSGLVNVGNFTSSNKDKCSKPFVLKSGETVKVKTKGDGSYFFRVLAKFSSLDAPISVGQSGGTLITVISGNALTEYTYTATEAEEYIGVCVFDDETSCSKLFKN